MEKMNRPAAFPKIFKMLMFDLNLRISDLARLCNTSDRYVYFVLKGERKASQKQSIIAGALGISKERFSQILSDFKQSRQRPQGKKESNEQD